MPQYIDYLTYTNPLTAGDPPCFGMPVKPIPYVDEASAALAHAWQERIQKLSPESGILFLSVTGIPIASGRCSQFDFVLGVQKSVAAGTAMAVIQHFFEKELEDYGIAVTIYQGVLGPGAAGDAGPGVHPKG
jgi:hypothetical protein